ncbi:hypothetical protein Tco_1047595, partial [Tanacetum coccineum]
VLWWDGESFAKLKEYGGAGNGEIFAHVSAGVVKGFIGDAQFTTLGGGANVILTPLPIGIAGFSSSPSPQLESTQQEVLEPRLSYNKGHAWDDHISDLLGEYEAMIPVDSVREIWVTAYEVVMVVVRECEEGSGVHWWRRVEKVVVGRRRYDGVMVVDDGESELKSGH